MNNIKCIVLDFDDTIILSEEMKTKVFFDLSKRYGEIGIDYYNNNIKKGFSREYYLKELSHLIIKNSLIDINSSKYLYTILLNEFTTTVKNNLLTSQLLPNFSEFIEEMNNRGKKLYISSKSREDDILNTLSHKNLLNYFKGIYGLSNTKLEHLDFIKDLENIEFEEMCFIGDSKSDYDVSVEKNTKFIGINTMRNNLKDIQCIKINNYAEIMNIFD
tara:strand:- start:160 stop:810 length:651 start_codon:yes stop_codon:yes gene_type:complete